MTRHPSGKPSATSPQVSGKLGEAQFPFGDGQVPFGGFADVGVGRSVLVSGASGASRAGCAGFRCTGGMGGFRVEVAKPSADACRGESALFGGWFPRAA